MALHGPIKVNTHTIGYWAAERRSDSPDGIPNVYRATVEWTPVGEGATIPGTFGPCARRAVFLIEHHYADGALILASKILAAAHGHVTSHQPHYPAPEPAEARS